MIYFRKNSGNEKLLYVVISSHFQAFDWVKKLVAAVSLSKAFTILLSGLIPFTFVSQMQKNGTPNNVNLLFSNSLNLNFKGK